MQRSTIGRIIALVLLFGIGLIVPARGGEWPSWFPRPWASPTEPNTLEQIAWSIDCIEDKILDDGTVVLKQPDVYSQSRMTLYRKNFEAQLYGAINQFNTVLSARLFRSDQAAFLSQTSLAAAAATAKSGRGSTTTTSNTVTPPALVSPGSGPGITPNGFAANSIVRPDGLTALGSAPFAQGFANGTTPYGLGIEPTVYLDELKRYQDHLNELRRVNMGDDIADSAGYGLYLMRIPVSIQPGELTYKGHGAILTTTLRHDFDNDFLTTTFRNMAINDLVDQLSPLLYELIRSDALKTVAGMESLDDAYRRYLQNISQDNGSISDDYRFVLSNSLSKRMSTATITLSAVNGRNYPVAPTEMYNVFLMRNMYVLALHAKDSLKTPRNMVRATDIRRFLRRELETAYDIVSQTFRSADPGAAATAEAYEQQVETIAAHIRNQEFAHLVRDYTNLARLLPGMFQYIDEGPPVASRNGSGVQRASFRQAMVPEQINPIAPVGPGPEGAQPRDPAGLPRLGLPPTGPVAPAPLYPGAVAGAGAVLRRDPYSSLIQAMTILSYSIAVESGFLNAQLKSEVKRVLGRGGLIAVEEGLLDARFRADIARVMGPGGIDCAAVDTMRFYSACPHPVTEAVFAAYVSRRWPIITFAIDPVVDQQNIADATSLRRDLQLALAFAFSTGQINFNQLLQFQRRIQQDAETIALNRTVSAFAHGNNTFGYRFTPRYQNPPLERSNFQVIANQLYRGGPGRNYQMNNSKLEPGQRELSAVVLMPSFLHGVRMDVTGNWFPLHDPDEMEIPTKRMIEQGRKVVELRQALDCIHDQRVYRVDDLQRLRTRAYQLEQMLPMQTLRVNVPFENTLGGFALFQEGSTALVPMLDSFEGGESIDKAAMGTDLFLQGKHFSVQETNVIIGGVYLSPNSLDVKGSNQTGLMNNTVTPPAASTNLVTLNGGISPSGSPFTTTVATSTTPASTAITTANNPAIDIISREVLRVSIPAGVRPTTILDADGTARQYVEVFVATPTGVSNRLLVPYVDSSAPAAPAVAYAIDSGSKLTINYTLERDEHGLIRPVRGVPGDKCDLTINWTSPLGVAPQTIQVAIAFTYNKNAKLTIPLARPVVRGTNGKYKLSADDLRRVAHDFIQAVANIDPTISLSNPLQPITVDSVTVTPDDASVDTQPLKATGSLMIIPQILNDHLGRAAPAADPGVMRTGLTPWAVPAPARPRPPDVLDLPPLPQSDPAAARPSGGSPEQPGRPQSRLGRLLGRRR
jgi:hypothetical protein